MGGKRRSGRGSPFSLLHISSIASHSQLKQHDHMHPTQKTNRGKCEPRIRLGPAVASSDERTDLDGFLSKTARQRSPVRPHTSDSEQPYRIRT